MSGQAWFALGLFLAISAVMPWLLLRDLRRARTRQVMRPLARSFEAFKVSLGLALLPAMSQAVRAAADMQASMERLQATLKPNPDAMRRLREMAHPTLDPDVAKSLGDALRAAVRRKDGE